MKSLATLILLLYLLATFGCGQASRQVLLVQVCVRDRNGLSELLRELRSVAASRHMEFFDSSSDTARQLPRVGYAGRERQDGSPVVTATAVRGDGMAISVSNVGLPGYQVAVGISEGANRVESQRLADEFAKWLGGRWHVDVVQPGAAAVPKADCR